MRIKQRIKAENSNNQIVLADNHAHNIANNSLTETDLFVTQSFLPGIPPVLQRIYASRGIDDVSLLDKRLEKLYSFHSLKDIQKAVERLEIALRQQERILVIGDFDADGATSTALAVSALRLFGAKHVDFLVPNRFAFGYGLTPAIVDVAFERKPSLIITVDNGIASIEGVQAANDKGIDVLITDHHLSADVLPNAYAIVNPNQPGDEFPSKAIAGVGVIFYTMLALRHQLKTTGYFDTCAIAIPNMAQFLDLVALGTVADVVPLDHNNRILVSQGLSRIRQGLARPGIQALVKISGRDISSLRENDLGFFVAPRLNAAGRLDDMSLGIDCLLQPSMDEAEKLAQYLDTLNTERKKIETEMSAQAQAELGVLFQNMEKKSQQLPVALCLMDDQWHQGVIGILAGRLKERYHRPVIVFAKTSEEELKGSARSIQGINIRDILAAVDKDHPGLMTKFGGHAMAAGLSISYKNWSQFREYFVAEVGKHLDISQCQGEILSDGPLVPSELTLSMAHILQEAGPFGQQFPEPLFDNYFEIIEQRLVGSNHLKLVLKHEQGGDCIDAIAFNIDANLWPNERVRFVHAAYKLDINEYRQKKRLQLIIQALIIKNY